MRPTHYEADTGLQQGNQAPGYLDSGAGHDVPEEDLGEGGLVPQQLGQLGLGHLHTEYCVKGLNRRLGITPT